MTPFLLVALLLASLCCGAPTVQLVSVDPLTTRFPIRVKLWGNFSIGWAVRFANSTSLCDSGSTFAGGLTTGNVPNSSISNVERWNSENSASSWVVDLSVSQATENAWLCWTNDTGVTWWPTSTKEHSTSFRIWRKYPTAIGVPQTPTAGAILRVLVMQNLTTGTKGVLVHNTSSCSGSAPRGSVTPMALYGGGGFEFRVYKPFSALFLCIATPPSFDVWSMVPFDPANTLVMSRGIERVPTGAAPNPGSVQIYPYSIRGRRGHVNCTTPIAGAHVACTLEIWNKTAIPITPSSVSISLLTDGGGVVECPTPPLTQVTSTRLSFTFVPQRSGNEGTIQFLFNNAPLLVVASNDTIKYFSHVFVVSGVTPAVYVDRVIPWYLQDASIVKLSVYPTFTYLQQYSSTNLLSLAGFNVTALWPTQYGVYRFKGTQNGTLNGDMQAVTLNASTVGRITQTITVPPYAERCRMVVHYYFLGLALVHESTVYIGSVSIIVNGQRLRSLLLYNYLRQIIIVGDGLRAEGLLGDIFTVEQLAMEIAILSNYQSLTVVFEIDGTQSRQLYFMEPSLFCTVSRGSAKTDLHDIHALQRLYFAVGASNSSLGNWVKGGVFNGDPCTNSWRGVICRHMRVVQLRLGNASLRGVFPHVRELTMLEYLDVSNNYLTGSFPVNNSRLVELHLTNNQLTSFSYGTNTFPLSGQHCLRSLHVAGNSISSFPSQISLLTNIQILDMSHNQLHNTLPSDLSSLRNLAVLHLTGNNLIGTLPSLFPPSLVSLDLSANRLEGSIPSSWYTMRNLLFLDISGNVLNGTIPNSLSEIRTGSALVFRAQDNFLTGTLPLLHFRLTDLRNNFFACPTLRPELETNTSVMNNVVQWGEAELCDYHSASAGY